MKTGATICSQAYQLIDVMSKPREFSDCPWRIPTPEIPLFIVSYTGWKNAQTIQQNLPAAPNVAGVLVIDSGVFASSPQYGGMVATGPLALWGLICCLHQVTNSLQAASTNPVDYAV